MSVTGDDAEHPTRATGGAVLRTPPPNAFSLDRYAPSAALAPWVVHLWRVAWDLGDGPPHEQVTLPHPSPHVSVDEDGVARLYGPPTERFERTLARTGWALGVRWRPGALRPLLGEPVRTIVDQVLPARALPGLDGDALAAAVRGAASPAAAVAAADQALCELLPLDPDPAAQLAERAVTLIAEDRTLQRVADLAERLALSARSVQRLFAEYVGVGPAWVVRRYRLHEAAAQAGAGRDVDWARLAAELGFYDQAHLVREFTRTVGTPPARYAASGRASPRRPPGRAR